MFWIPAGTVGAVAGFVRVPRPQLVAVADLLDEAVGDFLSCRVGLRPETKWEAPLEAVAISNLMVRNVEAAAVLARCDEVLAPASWANARNVFDAATRILWLLVPQDRFEAEARRIALLVEYERFHRRMAAILEEDGDTRARTHLERAEVVREFHTGVAAKLPPGYAVPRGMPPTDQFLREVGVAGIYQLYIEGSQYMHAAMRATSMYVDRDETGRRPTESVTIVDWILPLRTCWICLGNAGRFVINRLSPAAEWGHRDWATGLMLHSERLRKAGFPRMRWAGSFRGDEEACIGSHDARPRSAARVDRSGWPRRAVSDFQDSRRSPRSRRAVGVAARSGLSDLLRSY